MPTVNQATGTQSTCAARDVTPPPTPVIHRSRAFERGTARATVVRNDPAPISRPRPDPAYFELHNVEPGTKIQLINISKKPDASFADKKDIVELELTGRDVQNRRAAVYLTQDQLDAIDLKGGDIYRLRVVDAAGNASEVVTNELEPDDWGNQRIRDLVDSRWETTLGTTENMLDGEGVRKNVIIKTVNDGRPPLMLEDKLGFSQVSVPAKLRDAAKTVFDARDAISRAVDKEDEFTPALLKAYAADDRLSPEARAAFEELAKAAEDPSDALAVCMTNGALRYSDFKHLSQEAPLVVLEAELAIEPHSRVRVQNTRTGESKEVQVGADQKLRALVAAGLDGDTVLVTPFDNENHEGKALEFRLAASCPKGYAPKLDILGARLGGVI